MEGLERMCAWTGTTLSATKTGMHMGVCMQPASQMRLEKGFETCGAVSARRASSLAWIEGQ